MSKNVTPASSTCLLEAKARPYRLNRLLSVPEFPHPTPPPRPPVLHIHPPPLPPVFSSKGVVENDCRLPRSLSASRPAYNQSHASVKAAVTGIIGAGLPARGCHKDSRLKHTTLCSLRFCCAIKFSSCPWHILRLSSDCGLNARRRHT